MSSHDSRGSQSPSKTMTKFGSISLTKDQEMEFREIFNLVDRDGGGSISKDELGNLLKTLNLSVTSQELELMVYEIDKNSDGEIQFDEFVQIAAKKINSTYTSQELIKAFETFQPRQNPTPGRIKVDDLFVALSVYTTEKLTSDQIKDIKKMLDASADSEGYLAYDDYVRTMMGE